MKKILTILSICVGMSAFGQELEPITTTNLRVIINRINTLQTLIGSRGGNGVTAEWVRNEISDSISAVIDRGIDLDQELRGDHKVMDINTQTGSAYTLVLADAHRLVIRSNSSANTVTVPTNTSVAFPVGTQITVVQAGAGTTSIAAAGGVTINSADGALDLRVRYSTCSLVKTATDTWLLIGDMEVPE